MVPPASCRGGFTVAVDLQSAAVSCCNGFVYRPLRGYRHQVLLARRHTVLLRSHVVHQRDQCLQRLGRLEELCQLLRSGDLELAVDHSEFLLRVGQGDNRVHLLLRRAHRGLHRLGEASLVRAGLVELRRQRAEGALDAPDESLHAAECLDRLVHVKKLLAKFFCFGSCCTKYLLQTLRILRENLEGLDVSVKLEGYCRCGTAHVFVYLLTITYIVNNNQICHDHADVHITVHSQIHRHVILGKTLGFYKDRAFRFLVMSSLLRHMDFGRLVLIQGRSVERL